MNITDTISDTYTDVWQWREKSAAWFVIPDTADALAFAVTEAGEAVDAWLRQVGPKKGFKRNNHRDADIWAELGDCFFMCATALGRGETELPDHLWQSSELVLPDIVEFVAKAWKVYVKQRIPYLSRWYTKQAMYQIAALFADNGHDLRATVQARLERLEAKHKEGITI